jgi:hypothetical protein
MDFNLTTFLKSADLSEEIKNALPQVQGTINVLNIHYESPAPTNHQNVDSRRKSDTRHHSLPSPAIKPDPIDPASFNSTNLTQYQLSPLEPSGVMAQIYAKFSVSNNLDRLCKLIHHHNNTIPDAIRDHIVKSGLTSFENMPAHYKDLLTGTHRPRIRINSSFPT